MESQIEGAREASSNPKQQLTPEQQQAAREIERLRLSRSYVKHQIAGATHPSRVQTLQNALKDIEEKLDRLQRGCSYRTVEATTQTMRPI